MVNPCVPAYDRAAAGVDPHAIHAPHVDVLQVRLPLVLRLHALMT